MLAGRKMLMKRTLIIAAIIVGTSVSVFSQSNEVCISQAAANVCGQNARLIPALEQKIAVLEAAMLEKDKSIAELIETNRKNIADLQEALKRTEIALATKTGELIGNEAEKVRLLALLDFAIKNTKKKRNALITIF